MEHVENLLKTTLAELERLLATRTVVGEPMTVGSSTIVPLVSVGFAFGAGGGSGKEQKKVNGEGAGAGSGGGGGIRPVAVIIADETGVRVEPVRRGAATMIEKIGEAVGTIVEKQSGRKD